MTELDKRLQKIALEDWVKFEKLIGTEALMSAKICLLSNDGRSYGEVVQKLGVTVMKVRYQSNKCNCKE
jgi:hypothetical protein